jgi:hypothetical protein
MRVEDVPQTGRDRRRTLRQARLGLVVPETTKYADAFKTFSSLELLFDAFDREKTRTDNVGKFANALSSAWNGRKSWRI